MSVIKPILSAMSPVLAVNDLQVALDHYRDVLGFEVTWTWGDPASRAGVARDGFELQLAAQYGPPGTSVVYFQVNRVDDYYQRCLHRGASIEHELADRPWLMRDFRVLDPSGNKLGFGQPN
ncbi:MAG: glyoxalase superfamily protein [Gemmatimonadota bacterium]